MASVIPALASISPVRATSARGGVAGALLTETNRQAIETISAAVDPAAPWAVQIRQAVEAWITNAAVAGLSVAYAQTDRSQGYRGIICLAIEAERPGFHREKPFELHGGHAIGVGGFRLVDYFAALAPPA